MAWVKWVSPILLLVAGISWAFSGTLDSLTTTKIVSGFNVGNLLGYVAIVIGAWSLYEMTMKK